MDSYLEVLKQLQISCWDYRSPVLLVFYVSTGPKIRHELDEHLQMLKRKQDMTS